MPPPLNEGDDTISFMCYKCSGDATIPDAPFESPDGTPYQIDADYFGGKRDASHPAPGPFRAVLSGEVSVRVWPRN